jgi:hypothetical protein
MGGNVEGALREGGGRGRGSLGRGQSVRKLTVNRMNWNGDGDVSAAAGAPLGPCGAPPQQGRLLRGARSRLASHRDRVPSPLRRSPSYFRMP